MINNPLHIEITNATGNYKALELLPVYREGRENYEATASIRLFTGYTPEDSEFAESIVGIEQYLDNLDIMGENDPHFLGTLHFTGIGLLEWRYDGGVLTEFEVLQVIDNLWSLQNRPLHIEP